jgi:hypothetical protein
VRGPTGALLWEIWEQHRSTVAAIGGLTVMARVVDVLETRGRTGDVGIESSPLITLLKMVAFLLLFAVFNYTESSSGRGVGQFPRRLFTLPVTSLRLVAVPVLAGITSIELLYLLWMEPLSRAGSASVPFVAILLAALVVFYLWVLWTLERAGSLRLLSLGVIAMAVFAIGILPSFPPSPPPWWRSEAALAGLVAGLAVVAFLLAWRHVARLRAGGGRHAHRAESFFGWIAEATPARRKTFASPVAAHFWFEWRSSGIVLPALVAGVVLVVIAPMSWLMRGDGGDTMRLLLAALATPAVLAIPVGAAFSKPTFWSEDLALPAFVAVRPLSAADLVATKVRVAAASVALAWLVLLSFVALWLTLWGNLDSLSQLAIQVWAFHGRSVAAVYGAAALVVMAGMCLTWRFMVSRLWSGLSGRRTLFLASVTSVVVVAIAGLVFINAGRPGWLLDDPARLAPIVWIAAVAVIAKCWLAVYAWRGVAARYRRMYLLIWLAGTASFVTLGSVVWGMVRIYLRLDVDRVHSVVILLALLAVPLARVGLAPSSLTRNRHQ